MKLLQSLFARRQTSPLHRAPASQPKLLDRASLKQVGGGLPRVSSPTTDLVEPLPRVS